MSKISALTNTWDTVKEIDLQPLRQDALRSIRLVIVGEPGSGRRTLASQMRHDPTHHDIEVDTPLIIFDLEGAEKFGAADLILLLLDSRNVDFTREAALSRTWADSGKKVLVLINIFEESSTPQVLKTHIDWKSKRVVTGSILDTKFLQGEFASAVMAMLPGRHLSLGRHFPLFRVPVAHNLINDTSFSNAAYSMSTGLAEMVPLLNIPLTVTDMIVLSKNQAFLVYKLGLALGLSTKWQDYVTEFSGVLGIGFLLRQIARSLVGLIPFWGIFPKVAVAYSGTFVVGNVVLQWYLTGRHISRQQMREMYSRAYARGKLLAYSLFSRMPRLRLPRLRLPRFRLSRPRMPRLPRRKRRALPAPQEVIMCENCGRGSAQDAEFCQYCGQLLKRKVLGERPE